MSFTAGALLHPESIRVAQEYAQAEDWAVARRSTLEGNLLQARSSRTADRLLGEITARLQTLTATQFEVLCHGTIDDQIQVLWLSVCKRYQFIRDFAIEVVRERYLLLGDAITRSDYERFFTAKAAWHPKLEGFGEATRDKLRQNLFKMLREAGFLSNDGHVIGAFLSSGVVREVVAEDPSNLMVFPVREEDVERWAQQ